MKRLSETYIDKIKDDKQKISNAKESNVEFVIENWLHDSPKILAPSKKKFIQLDKSIKRHITSTKLFSSFEIDYLIDPTAVHECPKEHLFVIKNGNMKTLDRLDVEMTNGVHVNYIHVRGMFNASCEDYYEFYNRMSSFCSFFIQNIGWLHPTICVDNKYVDTNHNNILTVFNEYYPSKQLRHIPSVSEEDYRKHPIVFNTKGVNLSSSSLKKLRDFKVGDVLYETSDGELVGGVGDSDDVYPIAICCDINGARAVFCGLNFVSIATPDKGSVMPLESQYSDTVLKTGSEDLMAGDVLCERVMRSLVNGGFWMLFSRRYWESPIDEQSLAPVMIASWRYHTIATKRGDWFVPTETELLSMAKNIELIDGVRKTLKRKPLVDMTTTDDLQSSTIHRGGQSEEYMIVSLSNCQSYSKTLHLRSICIPFIKIRFRD